MLVAQSHIQQEIFMFFLNLTIFIDVLYKDWIKLYIYIFLNQNIENVRIKRSVIS